MLPPAFLAGLALAASLPLSPAPAPAPSPAPTSRITASARPDGTLAGLHIPWAAGGPYRAPDGTITTDPEPWPAHHVASVRLWDTGTTWAQLEPADGALDFGRLDANVAAATAHGTTDILMVLGGTPTWEASDLSGGDAPWLPAGSASPPRDLARWQQYVTAVATRYRDRISAYQIGNEPNVPWFWRGTPAQLRRYVKAAVTAIRAADPAALIVAPGPVISGPAPRIGPWLAALRGLDLDALAVNWYPPEGTPPSTLAKVVARVRATAARRHVAALPLWFTEAGITTPADATSKRQRGLVRQALAAARDAGVARMYWYAWSARTRPDLLPLRDDTPAGRALTQYAAQGP